MKTESQIEIDLPSIIGGGYGQFWRCKKRFRVVKGSRGSKKSATTALNHIYRLMEYPLANLLVIRQVANDLKQSCYAQLLWAINRLKVGHLWKARVSPLELEYIPTGQKIIFRGLDKWSSITSMTVDKGYLCWCWIEECFEISEEAFDAINESLRAVPEPYFIQLTLTFNPWSSSWLKARFFDNPDERTFAITTTYKCNEWLSDEDRYNLESTKQTNPDRYKVVALGEWGLEAGQYFSEWRESVHVVKPFEIPRNWIKFRSCDFGISRPYCCLWFAVDYDNNLYCYRELYGWGGRANIGTGETAKQIGERIAALEARDENVSYGVLDSACANRTGVSGPTIKEELNNVLISKRLVVFGDSSKGRLEGANQFKQRLIGNKLADGTYKPAIYFFSNCVHSIRTIPQIGHDKHNAELPDTDAEDH